MNPKFNVVGRKQLTGLAAAVCAATLALSGCSASSSTAPSSGKVTLDYWNFTAATMPIEKQLIRDFEKKNPNIKINLKELPLDNYARNLQIGATTGTNPDVFEAIPEWIYDFEHFKVVRSLSPATTKILTNRVAPVGMQGVTINGTVYGSPFRTGESAVFVNTALLQKAGVTIPDKWTQVQFREIAQKITKSAPGVHGFAVPVSSAQSDLGSSWTWLTHFFSYGGTMIENGKAAINTPEAVKSLTEYVDYYKSGISPKEELTWITNDVVQAFGNGKVAMWMNGPWFISTIETSFPDLKFQVVPLPTGATYGSAAGGTFIGVSAKTKYPVQAEAFIEYMTSTPVLTKWATAGNFLPPVPEILSGAAFKTPKLAPYTDHLSDPGVQVTGATPANTALLTDLQTGIEDAMAGRATPQEALDKVAASWDVTLAKPYK